MCEKGLRFLLLKNNGKTQQEIAKFLGCSARTVVYWCVHGDLDHLESLHAETRTGALSKGNAWIFNAFVRNY